MRRGSFLAVLLCCAAIPRADAQAPPQVAGGTLAALRAEFRAAVAAARAGEIVDDQDSAGLRRYPLYAYLQYERIAARLGEASGAQTAADADAERFLDAHAGEPVAVPLRYAWLESLARRERWQRFAALYREDVADDELRCQRLRARVELDGTERVVAAAVDRWLTPRRLPIECEPVFEWLRGTGALTEDLVERRARLLLENGETGFARVIAGRLPEDRAAPLLRWADLIERPASELAAYVDAPSSEIAPATLRDAWRRLARDAPDAALNLYAPLMETLAPDDREAGDYALALALGLAWDRRREALDFFELAGPDRLDDYALGWQARAALWNGDWTRAEASLAAMSGTLQDAARWRYWAARLAERRDGRASARDDYEAVLADDNYYSGLAAAHLRRRVRPRLEPLPRDPATVAVLAGQSAFVRARELLSVGFPVAAMREWRHGFAQLDAESQRQTIHLAAEWQWYDLAVATATRFGVFNDYALLYPRPYGNEVLTAAAATNLTEGLVYGVIRQESLYRADAVSSGGARGLMQIKPGTATSVAGQLEDLDSGEMDLLDPSVNIRLGTAELERLMARFGGQLPVALAAYNAGPNAAERWLPDAPMDADIWIENIPYNETREYVQRVLWHSLVFRWLETRRAQDTSGWLGRVSRP